MTYSNSSNNSNDHNVSNSGSGGGSGNALSEVRYQRGLDEDLYIALDNRSLEGVNLAIEAGADVNCVHDYKDRPLHVAISNNDREMVRTLLFHGADVHLVNGQRWSAVHFAVMNASQGYDIFQMLKEHGANLSAKTEAGRTPLHIAASVNYADLCGFLVEEGADIDALDAAGHNALHEACGNNNFRCAVTLIAYGSNKDGIPATEEGLEDRRGCLQWSPLQAAVSAGLTKKVLELLDSGMDVDARGQASLSALEMAEEDGHQDILAIINAHQRRQLATSVIAEIDGAQASGPKPLADRTARP